MKNRYKGFDSRSKEAFNIAQLGSLLAQRQEFLSVLRYDVNGADVISTNPLSQVSRHIQVKSRPTVSKNYIGKDLWIAFPQWSSTKSQSWYLIPHDLLLQTWGKEAQVQLKGVNNADKLSKKLSAQLAEFNVGTATFEAE